jgi:hypothetical protein
VAFATASVSASESVTSPTLTIVQDNPSIATTTVSYAVTGGTGSTADYSLAGGSVTIPAGSTSTTIPLVITNDTMYELDETLVLTLSSPINAALGPQTTLTYTITNDDAIPTMRLSRTAASGDEAVASANIGIELSHPSYLDSSAVLGISGTATRGSDYTVLPVTVSIPAGQTSANILLSVIDDTEIEAAETVVFTLSSPVNVSLDGSTTTYTIIDNDAVALPPTPAALTLIRPVTTKNLKNGVATATVWKIVNTGQTMSNRITLEARIPKDGKITSAGWKCTVVGAQRRCTKTFNGIVGGGTQNISITVVPSASLTPTVFTVDMYLKSTGVTTQRKAATWKITRYYTVGIGDSLRSIARIAYGRTDRWTVIRQANVKTYPSLIRSVRLLRGWKLLIP